MTEFLPPQPTTPELNTVYGVIAALADPAATKQKLDDLTTATNASLQAKQDAIDAQKAAQATIEGAVQAKANIDTMKAELEKKYTSIIAQQAVTQQLQDTRQKDLDLKEAELVSRVKSSRDELSNRENAVSLRETSMSQKESTIDVRDAESMATLDAANKMKSDYENRLQQLKQIIG